MIRMKSIDKGLKEAAGVGAEGARAICIMIVCYVLRILCIPYIAYIMSYAIYHIFCIMY